MKNRKLPLLLACFAIFTSTNVLAQDYENLIKDYVSVNKIREFKKSDLTDFKIDIVDNSESLKGTVVKFNQLYKGIPIFNSSGTALIKDGKIIYYVDNFIKNYEESDINVAALNKNNAFNKVSKILNNQEILQYPILNFNDPSPTDHSNAAKQRLVYAIKDGNLKLAYEFSLQEPKSPNYWDIVLDANTGLVIEKNNLNLSCNFRPDAFSHDKSLSNLDKQNIFIGPKIEKPQNFSLLVADNASYNIFPFPIEAPTFGSRSIVSNPWVLASSPDGWHYDGTTHYTNTRGNNAYAYEDTSALNTPGVSPDGGSTRNFNFPFGISNDQITNQNAAITNLFYVNNKMHDIFYKFGFNEAIRNFQKNNYSNGGLANDYVLAEAQDGGGTDNANFSTPADGTSGRMQMFMWSSVNRLFYYNAPSAAVPRQPETYTAAFGPALDAVGVTGDVKLASPIDGCTALAANSMAGKIGLIERGNCNFVVKVKNAQNAGAVGAIVYNATTSTSIGSMGGDDLTINIPSVLIPNSEGEYIKTQLAANTVVNVTLKDDPSIAIIPDGDFDNGVISHEYGHGISNRLTGTGYNCLNSTTDKEQMGEGWSDFFALMLTNQSGDNASVARGIGTYVIGEPTSGLGIRPMKYSPDFTVNNATYTMTNGLEYTNSAGTLVPDVHSIGFIWATILWDLHWKYVEKYGYSSDVMANTTNGSTRVLQLVTNALKLQVCNPSFTEGRDAILAAELALTAGADKCMIWRTFAKRGVGLLAAAGAKSSINDQVEDFSVPTECLLATSETTANSGISIYPNPAKNEFSIKFPSNTLGKVQVDVFDASGKLVSYQTISTSEKISTEKLQNGVYVVKMKGMNIDYSTKLMIKK